MLERKNQIPKDKKYCANKKYYDILYGYLQSISYFDIEKQVRLFEKKAINFSALSHMFNLTRQTLSTRFKNLINIDLVREYDDKYYELPTIVEKEAMLVPYSTLKVLTDTLSENAISTYAYLFNRWYANGQKEFVFTYEQIKNHIGICASTRSNDEIIYNILFILQKIGIIEVVMDTVKTEDNFGNIHTVYKLIMITTELK